MTESPRSLDDIYPLLKPSSWDGAEDCVCERLAELDEAVDLPWITWGWDEPRHFRFLTARELESLGATRKEVATKGVENLVAAKVTRNAMEVPVRGGDDLRMVAFGGMFAAEKILDEAFLKELQTELGADKLLVAIPRRAMLLVTKATTDRLATAFAMGVAGQFRRGESPPISSAVFTVVDGIIVSVLSHETGESDSPRASDPVGETADSSDLGPRGAQARRMRLTEHPMPASFIWGTVAFVVGLVALFFDAKMAVLGLALGSLLITVSLIVFYLREDVELTATGLSLRKAPIRALAWEEVESFTAHDPRTLLVELSDVGRAHYPNLPATHFERCSVVIEANFNVDLNQTVRVLNARVNASATLRSIAGHGPSRPAALSKGYYQPEPQRPSDNARVKAPYEMAIVVRNEDGRTRIELMVGGKDSSKVAAGAQRFALELAEKYRWDPEFSGAIRIIVVPTITPESEKLTKALDATTAELARRFSDKKWRTVDGSSISIAWSRGAHSPDAEPKA